MISACFIVKNEEKWLEGCLQNIRPIVSEIIVVDTGSTDRSKEIAQKFGARIFDFKWTADFSAARNFSMAQATQPWILNFDPDERIGAVDLDRIHALVKVPNVDAYSFKIRNYAPDTGQTFYYPCGGDYPEFEANQVGFFETQRIKLFRSDRGIHFVGAVHELVESTVTGRVLATTIPVHHFGEIPAEKERKSKHSVYFPILLQKVAQNPSDWKSHFELGCEYMSVDMLPEATASFEKARTGSDYAQVFSHLGHCYFKLQRTEDAERVFAEGMELHSADHDIAFNYAAMLIEQGQFKSALSILCDIIISHPKSYAAFRAAGYCLLNMEKLSEAKNYIESALRLFPRYEDALVDLAIIKFFEGDKVAAVDEAKKVLEFSPESARAQGLLQAIQAQA